MSQQNRDQPHRQQSSGQVPVDAETLKALLQQQSQQLALEVRRISLDEKQLDAHTKLAEKSMAINADLLKNAPREHRRTTVTYGVIVLSFILIVVGFMVFCLVSDKQDFVKEILGYLKNLTALVVTFIAGRYSHKSKKASDDARGAVQDVDVVE
jgi:hypothetical protein